jgi:formylglycine-generating enzyme required for sulfatase activity
VPGGTFTQGGSPEVAAPAHESTVSSFALDKYEVTVGRFRKFVAAYVSNTASAPVQGSGVNPAVPGTGWQSQWNTSLPATPAVFAAQLKCDVRYQTWTDVPGTVDEENRAIGCVNWREAFAFCIWDGGRLATESEWEYAAAGGPENRLYPWGSATPDCGHANFWACANNTALSVSAAPAGNGKWDHADLAGNVWEWAFDWYGTYSGSSTNDYANTAPSGYRVLRGGGWDQIGTYLRAAERSRTGAGLEPDNHIPYIGLRCARTAQ